MIRFRKSCSDGVNTLYFFEKLNFSVFPSNMLIQANIPTYVSWQKVKTQFENAGYVLLYFRCEGSFVETTFDQCFP